ncbi:bifunctional tetrahydrofolate synthase/dihydrofolate synthase [Leucothrix arctica]|uniref:Dihydrofolate synthase/folylpolyglutamate synthase n=1 Tax=Leucothrix arctica TaxID=1481894 RepID=A0A317CF44_9GAMM|nr:bifunctional tetrahydrofolate synthase/dihydrofolate synthase [Leucothrix arctica]PWQ96691.1 bifunctional tetrahydrofolate synthase/dihydrofolate synthase [Leucothrix arctica]
MSRTLTEWLEWQEQLHFSSIDLGLDRVQAVAEQMQLDTLDMPVVSVAGTNGKGSSVAMLDSIYRQAGYSTGCYTSPHLIKYNERICINGAQATDEEICEAFTAIDKARGEISLTYFEFGTLAGAYLFRKHNVDVTIFEVGLGGRLDAVNLWDADISIITTIDIDHVAWLGNDREKIGVEKAGIMREGKTVVCGDTNPTESMGSEAIRIGAKLLQQGKDFSWRKSKDGQTWKYVDTHRNAYRFPLPKLRGDFQLNNAASVITAILDLNPVLPVSNLQIKNGLLDAQVTGRLQKLGENPELLADVAHNPQSAQALASYLKNNPVKGQTVAIFSALVDKDLEGIISPLKEYFDVWHLITLEGPRVQGSQILSDKLQAVGISAPIECHKDTVNVIKTLQKTMNSEDRVVAFGSFLVVSAFIQGLNASE